jgi:hypothetical protein
MTTKSWGEGSALVYNCCGSLYRSQKSKIKVIGDRLVLKKEAVEDNVSD